MRKNYTLQDRRVQEQAAQGGCGMSLSGAIQNVLGHVPVSAALGDPPSAGGLDWRISRGLFQPQWFCDSVRTSARLTIGFLCTWVLLKM